MQLIFAVIVATGTFFLVPRGVSLGEISVQTEHRTWNFSEHTYKLNLIAQIPINNPNYLSVRPSDTIKDSFTVLVATENKVDLPIHNIPVHCT